MLLPAPAADLLGDQLIGRVGVGNAQQSLGEAHQDDALLGGERVLVHERIDATVLMAIGARGLDQPRRQLGDPRTLVGAGRCALGEASYEQGDAEFDLTYRYAPDTPLDGASLTVPLTALNQVSSSGLDDSPYIGLEAAYGGTFRQYQRMRVGWEAAFGYLPIDIKDSRTTSGTFTRTVHQFPTGDIIPPIAPYQGGSSGAGEPLISDTGTSLADDVATGTITGSNELDVDLFTLRFGPTFYWQLHPRWAVSASAGGVVGLVSGDYKFNAMAVLPTGTTHDSGKIGETEFTYGGYINALALFRVEEHADIFAGVQFMPMSDVKFRESGREAKLNLGGGLYFTAGINWPF